jgi:hypothetical protein
MRSLSRPAVLPKATRAVEPGQIADPGDAGRITAITDGYVLLVTAHAGPGETRTLTDPIYVGQTLDLFFETDGGDCVITADTAVNQAGNTSLTFADGGDHLRLCGGRDGSGGLAWRVVVNDGITLG